LVDPRIARNPHARFEKTQYRDCWRRLGTIVSTAATRRLIEAGYRRIYLLTDDFRLPAIRIYLALGYAPLFHAPGMPERWQVVLQQIG